MALPAGGRLLAAEVARAGAARAPGRFQTDPPSSGPRSGLIKLPGAATKHYPGVIFQIGSHGSRRSRADAPTILRAADPPEGNAIS